MKIKNLLLGILLSAASISGSNADSKMIKGLSFGPNIGYNFSEAYTTGQSVLKNIGAKRFKSNSYFLGLHLDYNHFLSDKTFIGVGYCLNYTPDHKEYTLSSNSVLLTKGSSTYKNKNAILFHKRNSHAYTLRVGTILPRDMALDINLSGVVCDFDMREATFTYEKIQMLNPKRNTYTFNHLKDSLGASRKFQRIGVAPGIALTIPLADKFSMSLNYRCEFYPKNKDGTKPKILTHNVFTKFSYHI